MKPIPLLSTKAHGVIDYVYGFVLIIAPFLIGFSDDQIATWVLVAAGVGVILSSLITDYELGVVKLIPMSVHLTLDVAAGAFLTISPWLLGFVDRVSWPHLLAGMVAMIVPISTTRHPSNRGISAKVSR